MLTAEDVEGVLSRIQGALFSEVPLSTLMKSPGLNCADLVDKHLTSSQVFVCDPSGQHTFRRSGTCAELKCFLTYVYCETEMSDNC